MSLPVKDRFHLPDGMIYLDGNSLGPLAKGVAERVQQTILTEWGEHLITGWNRDNWMAQPMSVANRIAPLLGAAKNSLVLGDTLSIKVYQALSAALDLCPDRKIILSDTGNFPTDLYMAEGLIAQIGTDHRLKTVAPEEVMGAIDEDVAVVMLTEVDYRTGRLHDMAAVTARAQEARAIMIWDLAHSAGAIPVDLTASNCEFAVGCTYKYLNGGPGAPAFIYIRPDLAEDVKPALSGWLGHDAPFAFEPSYRAGPGISRMRVGTPPVLQVAALDAALDAWDGIDMGDVRAASIRLTEQFIQDVEARIPNLTLASPRNPNQRGSQVSFRFEYGYAAMQALIARGVIGDFRAPDIMRFGFTPLFIDKADVTAAVDILQEIIDTKAYAAPEYQVRQAVT